MPRIYKVETNEELTLVKAETQSQALNHVIKSTYKVSVAQALDVVEYMQQGGEVEDATGEKAPADAGGESGAAE